jgi:hypothetical protein
VINKTIPLPMGAPPPPTGPVPPWFAFVGGVGGAWAKSAKLLIAAKTVSKMIFFIVLYF